MKQLKKGVQTGTERHQVGEKVHVERRLGTFHPSTHI